jgi:hypothetical protein
MSSAARDRQPTAKQEAAFARSMARSNTVVVKWQDHAARINAAWQQGVASILETGRLLIEAKAALEPDSYEAMEARKLNFGPATARKLMLIAGNKVICSHANKLPASWDTLYTLTTLDKKLGEGTLLARIKDGTITPKVERKDVAALLPKPKVEPKPEPVKPEPEPTRKGNVTYLKAAAAARKAAQGNGSDPEAAAAAHAHAEADEPEGDVLPWTAAHENAADGLLTIIQRIAQIVRSELCDIRGEVDCDYRNEENAARLAARIPDERLVEVDASLHAVTNFVGALRWELSGRLEPTDADWEAAGGRMSGARRTGKYYKRLEAAQEHARARLSGSK